MDLGIDRRSFLKLLSLLSLTPLRKGQTHLAGEANDEPHAWQEPNVLILLFDTLSAKHMSLHGYGRKATPNLTRFAEQATVYHAHYAGGNWTVPGTASLLTGTYPWSNRAFHSSGTVVAKYERQNLFQAFAGGVYHRIAYTHNVMADLFLHQFRRDLDMYLDPGEFCLIDGQMEHLFPQDAEIAYRSFEELLLPSVHGRSGSLLLGPAESAWMLARRLVLEKKYAHLYPRGIPRMCDLFFVLEDAIDGIKTVTNRAPQPFLAYFHLLPPHSPYYPRREFVDMFDDGWQPPTKEAHFFSGGHSDKYLNEQRRNYDEFLAYTDTEFGRLYDFLAQTGMLDNTYVVVTSDHGELFERGIYGHGGPTLYDPMIRIPLLISRPGQQQREDVYAPTSCVDLLPTLLHVTGQSVPDWCEGEVLPLFGGSGADNSERSVFVVEAQKNPKYAPLTTATVALIKGQYKLIHYFGYDGFENEYELYDLANDPEEMADLYPSQKSLAADLENELREKLREVNQPYNGHRKGKQ